MSIEITGVGWVTAAGMGCGRRGHAFELSQGVPAAIEPGRIFEKPYPPFRRMDDYSKAGIAAIALAMKDAGLEAWTQKRNIGLMVSTEYGCLDVDWNFYDTVLREEGMGASPALFAYTLPNSFLGEAAILFGLTGKAFVVNESNPLGLSGLKLAVDSLILGECEQILCGANNRQDRPPFSRHSKAAPGAVFLVIENSPARSRSYGELSVDGRGGVQFEKQKMGDLSELVRHCLSHRSRPGEQSAA